MCVCVWREREMMDRMCVSSHSISRFRASTLLFDCRYYFVDPTHIVVLLTSISQYNRSVIRPFASTSMSISYRPSCIHDGCVGR